MKGYLYLRDNEWFRNENVLKMGITTFRSDRENTYVTGEPRRGTYVFVAELPQEKFFLIERLLHNYLKPFHR